MEQLLGGKKIIFLTREIDDAAIRARGLFCAPARREKETSTLTQAKSMSKESSITGQNCIKSRQQKWKIQKL